MKIGTRDRYMALSRSREYVKDHDNWFRFFSVLICLPMKMWNGSSKRSRLKTPLAHPIIREMTEGDFLEPQHERYLYLRIDRTAGKEEMRKWLSIMVARGRAEDAISAYDV